MATDFFFRCKVSFRLPLLPSLTNDRHYNWSPGKSIEGRFLPIGFPCLLSGPSIFSTPNVFSKVIPPLGPPPEISLPAFRPVFAVFFHGHSCCFLLFTEWGVQKVRFFASIPEERLSGVRHDVHAFPKGLVNFFFISTSCVYLPYFLYIFPQILDGLVEVKCS